VGVFLALLIAGVGLAAWVMLRPPEPNRGQGGVDTNSGSAPPGKGTNSMGGTAGNSAPGQLPPGHPKIELPPEARKLIDGIAKEAAAKPNDVAAWNKYAGVALRAAMFDDSYYGKATEAYSHVLKLDPDNLEALRGIGDIDYDKQRYDEAIAAYEHYLKKKPSDPEVRTDLGTMYLYTGNPDQALVQYNKALKENPDLFQAHFNMGVAYAEQKKTPEALASLKKAVTLAPDDNARNQVNQLITRISGGSSSAQASAEPGVAQSGNAPATFHGEVEQVVRRLPIAGPKVGSVEWPAATTAKVLMNNFPMDQMPPFAKQKFLTDLKSGIDSAKKDYKVSEKVEVDIVDSSSGKVMETVTE